MIKGVVAHYPAGYPYRARFAGMSEAAGFEGGAVFIADSSEGYAAISDESTIADMIGEPLDAITVRLFPTREARDAFVARLRSRT